MINPLSWSSSPQLSLLLSKTPLPMESILHSSTSAAQFISQNTPKSILRDRFSSGKNTCLLLANNGFSSTSSSFSSSSSSRLISAGRRKSVVMGAKNDNKKDSHSFVPKPDEAGLFPEAILLKEKKVQEDGQLLPEFADAEEQELFEFLNLQLESSLNVKQMRHYEVVYLIHEKHEEEVGKVNQKVEDFLLEKKGKVWRFEDWGMRRLAYKIKKATRAHYICMNFELDAKWINDFKTMLDKDEMVIRHLVMKQDKAITEVQPPPPEFHTLRAGEDDDDEIEMEYDDGEEYEDEDDEDWDDEEEEGEEEDDDGIIMVDADEEYEESSRSSNSSKSGKKSLRAEPLAR